MAAGKVSELPARCSRKDTDRTSELIMPHDFSGSAQPAHMNPHFHWCGSCWDWVADCAHCVNPLGCRRRRVDDLWIRSMCYDLRRGRLEVEFTWKDDVRQFYPVSPQLYRQFGATDEHVPRSTHIQTALDTKPLREDGNEEGDRHGADVTVWDLEAGTCPTYRHNRPISSHSQGVSSWRASMTILGRVCKPFPTHERVNWAHASIPVQNIIHRKHPNLVLRLPDDDRVVFFLGAQDDDLLKICQEFVRITILHNGQHMIRALMALEH
jgi:hypothetical protein